MRVVLDTNIFVSGIHWPGACQEILRAWAAGDFEPIVSYPLFAELMRILLTFKLPLAPTDFQWLMDTLRKRAYIIMPDAVVHVVEEDPDDDKVIEAALAGHAAYIVTQDKHLLKIKEYGGIQIVHPEEFSRSLRNA